MIYRKEVAWGCVFLFAVTAGYASDDYTQAKEDPTAGIRAGDGAARWQNSVEVKAESRSNFYYGSGTRVTGTGGIVTPKVRFVTGNEKNKTDFTASVTGAAYDTSPRDNYLDAQTRLKKVWSQTSDASFTLSVGAQHGHDPFGVNRTDAAALAAAGRPSDARLDIWETFNGSGILRYGRPEAILNVEGEAGVFYKLYSNNDALTRGMHYIQETGRLAAFLNYSEKTALVVEGIVENTHFTSAASVLRDAVEYRVRTGVRYLATGKTRADVRVGYFNRQPRRPGVSGVDGYDFSSKITLAPEDYYNFTFEAGRDSVPGYLGAGAGTIQFNNTQYVQLGWNHSWTERFKTELSGKYSHVDFKQANGTTPRHDRLYEPILRATYAVGRHLYLLANATYAYRASDAAGADYNVTTGQLGARYEFY